MISRRNFLSLLAAVPVVGRFVPEPERGACEVWSITKPTVITDIEYVAGIDPGSKRPIGILHVRDCTGTWKTHTFPTQGEAVRASFKIPNHTMVMVEHATEDRHA